MPKRIIKLKRSVLEALDLPEESLGDTTKITVLGMSHMLIENHDGIYEYSCTRVQIKAKEGIICVTGEDIILRELSSERVYIGGKINSFGVQ